MARATLKRGPKPGPAIPSELEDGAGIVAHSIERRVVRVNLLPAEVREARSLRHVQIGIGAAAAVLVVAIGGGWWHESSELDSAKADQTSAQARHDGLNVQVGRLQPVDGLFLQVDKANTLLTTTAAGNVAWSRLVNQLASALPTNTWLTTASLGATAATATTPAATASTPAASAGTAATPGAASTAAGGTVTLSGEAGTVDEVADLLDSLAKVPSISDIVLSSVATASGSTLVTWGATATLTPSALQSAKGGNTP